MHAPTPLDLSFAAPVPRGNVVTFVRLQSPEDDGRVCTALVDTTAGLVYCEEAWFGLFAFPAAASEPMSLPRERGWTVVEELVGRVVSATLATSKTPREPAVRTRLFIDTSSTSPYR